MGGTASKLNTADAQPDPERSPADDDVSVYQCNLQQLLIYYYSVIPYYNNRMHICMHWQDLITIIIFL